MPENSAVAQQEVVPADPLATDPATAASKKKARRRVFYAVPKGQTMYQSVSKPELKKALKEAGLGLSDVQLIYGEPRKVQTKTETYF